MISPSVEGAARTSPLPGASLLLYNPLEDPSESDLAQFCFPSAILNLP
jgi:hypothetical protein